MNEEYIKLLNEIKEMQKEILSKQEKILENTLELKDEQNRLRDEIRINNFVVNNLFAKNEILN